MQTTARQWTEYEKQTALRMKGEGVRYVDIGKAILRPGDNDTKDANYHRGKRILADIASPLPQVSTPLRHDTPTSKPTEERIETGDRLEISLPKTRVQTLEELIVACEVDTDRWEVERFVCNKWEMGYKTEEGPGSLPLFQVKAWFRAKKAEYSARQALLAAVEMVRQHAPTYPMIVRGPMAAEGLLFELSLPDVHVGKLAWGAECGENYDIKLACDVFMEAFSALVQDALHRPIARIVFPVGNDLLNCDGLAGTTTAGTVQSNDGRYQKAYQVTLGLLVGAIDRLRELAPVEVLSIPGNHDTLSAWTLTETLKAWYRTAGDVSVDNAPTLRKYRHWGRCLLGWTHGDKERPDDLPLLMATEQPELWSATRWREWHLGHLHKSATKIKTVGDEYHGVRVRTLPSLCASDVWHTQQGYTGNIRSAESYFWHQERGLVGTGVYNV